ncbi:MAG: glycosyltransferase family 4 protein [Crocinitomicaceae bacterium]|nr:glycosyltransferase family 4 protein [Crocinitomicaceae bacterium]
MMNDKPKIVFVYGWYSSPFGYIHNNLPKALAQKGCDVHIITSTSQQYSNSADYDTTYAAFLGPRFTEAGTTIENGVKIHRLPMANFKTEIYPKGIYKKLKELKPDIVHLSDLSAVITFKVAVITCFFKFKFITSSHILRSVFPLYSKWNKLNFLAKLKWNLLHKIPGRFVYAMTDLTTYPTTDAKDIALKFFGFKNKKNILKSLAVDTSLFSPKSGEQIDALKTKYGFHHDDFICLYTGRFSEDKNPHILALAIQKLRTDYPQIKGFFIGDGVQNEKIKSIDGCSIHGFVAQEELSNLYNLASLGVWPRQESTSMLDCLACRTAIIVNDTVIAKERVDGNGEIFAFDSVESLANKIEKLFLDKNLLDLYGKAGHDKIVKNHSWDKYAEEYLEQIKKLDA